MSRVDLHPEDLLDREREGRLTAAERDRLEAHVAACSACALARAAGLDFEREAGRERTGDQTLAARLAASAADRLEAEETPAPRRAWGDDGRVRWGRRLLVAALVSFSAAAAAVGGWYVARRAAEPPAASGPQVEAGSGLAASPVLPGPAPAAPVPRTGGRSGRTASPPPPVELPAPAVPDAGLTARAPRAPTAPPAPGAEELLRLADEARRDGRYDEAWGVYGELRSRFRGSRQEVVARVTFGRLRLDAMDDPAGALTLFDDYLASGPGPLEEEATVGRALALGRLGRSLEEAAAWERLLARFPNSANAARARARLEELR